MIDTAILKTLDEQAWNMLRGMVADLTDEQAQYIAPAIDERSLLDVAVHSYNSTFFMSFALAGKDWPTPPAQPATVAELLTTLDRMHEQVQTLLSNLPEDALEKTYDMPWGEQWTGRSAIAISFAHHFVHIGGIQGIRAMGGFPTPPEKRQP